MENWTDLPLQATPDFIGGFIYGMTADSETEIIELCYKAPTPNILDLELQSAINELTKHTIATDIAAGSTYTLFIRQFPKTLTTC